MTLTFVQMPFRVITWIVASHLPLNISSRDPERSNSWVVTPMLRAQYLENGWRYRLLFKEPLIGNGPWGTKWSRDRYMTSPWLVIDQSRWRRQYIDPNTLRVQYRENSWGCWCRLKFIKLDIQITIPVVCSLCCEAVAVRSDILATTWLVYKLEILHQFCYVNTIRYDTIEEINVDSKAEYTA